MRFSSSPIHIINHLFEDTEIRVPRMRVDEKRSVCGMTENIKDERS